MERKIKRKRKKRKKRLKRKIKLKRKPKKINPKREIEKNQTRNHLIKRRRKANKILFFLIIISSFKGMELLFKNNTIRIKT